MRALLDVNVLIALLDVAHTSHSAARKWLDQNAANGWASCPITQNGCLRIMSHVSYLNTRSVRDVTLRLREATATHLHEFWPDDVSLLDDRVIDSTRIHGPRQLSDVYLLALAVRHSGALVTFDRSIGLSAVRGATAAHLVLL
jgi:uncharacterized protein